MVVAERARSRVRCDDWTGRELEDMLDTGRAEMRHVEDDPESVHLTEDSYACSRQPTPCFVFTAAVREQRPAHMGERDHPNAELVEDLEDALVRPESKRALHRDDERDLRVVQGGVDLRTGSADRNIAHIELGLALERRDLPQRLSQVRLRDLRIAVERADLDVDAACA